jgi:hypothetical protein
MVAKPDHETRVSGSVASQRGCQEAAELGRETTSHARSALSPFAPPADGRREFSASEAPRRLMLYGASVLRLQGRKTLASHFGPRPRERSPRKRETNGER